MALPYPEGEVYFKTKALKLIGGNYNFDASDPKSFYSHFLIENVWNTTTTGPHTEPYNNDNMREHKRSKLLTGYASLYNTKFGIWDSMHIMFGEKPVEDVNTEPNINRHVTCELNRNYNEIRDHDYGGPPKVLFRPIKLGGGDYMYIDLVTPIRAIYLPLAHKASAVNEDLCTYLMIDFRLRKGASIRSPMWKGRVDATFDGTWGLGRRNHDTLCFNIPGIYNYLIIPRQMRNPNKGLYQPEKEGEELITIWTNTKLPKEPTSHESSHFTRDIRFDAVLSSSFGVEVVWQPYEYKSWAVDFITHAIYLGLAFVPEAGPLLSVAFSISMQILTDPDKFKSENPLNLASDVLAAVVGSAMAMRGNVHTPLIKGGAP